MKTAAAIDPVLEVAHRRVKETSLQPRGFWANSAPSNQAVDFGRIARAYRWLEYLTFGPMLSRCRLHSLPQLTDAEAVLVLGDGDGRFVERFLRANHHATVDVVDSSAAMLRLLARRVSRVEGTAERVRLNRCDVLDLPAESLSSTDGPQAGDGSTGFGYDLVVTHFFLDCFSTAEIEQVLLRILPLLRPGARWVLSEFAVPPAGRGLFRLAPLAGRLIIAGLYRIFNVLTGLRARCLPDYGDCLRTSGFTLAESQPRLRGLLSSEVWVRVLSE